MIVTLNTTGVIEIKRNGKVIKKQTLNKKAFESNNILPEQLLDKKGRSYKKTCLIKYDGEYFKIRHSFEEVLKLISPLKVKGYIRYD